FPFLEESICAFTHVFGRTRKTKQSSFQEQAFFLRHLDAAFDGFHGVLQGERGVGDHLFRHGFRRRKKLGRLVDMIDQAYALRLFGGNHFAGEAELVCDTFAAESREALRAAVAGDDAEFHFRLPELGGFAGEADSAGKGELATAAEREPVDGANGGLSKSFEKVEDTLAEEGEIL